MGDCDPPSVRPASRMTRPSASSTVRAAAPRTPGVTETATQHSSVRPASSTWVIVECRGQVILAPRVGSAGIVGCDLECGYASSYGDNYCTVAYDCAELLWDLGACVSFGEVCETDEVSGVHGCDGVCAEDTRGDGACDSAFNCAEGAGTPATATRRLRAKIASSVMVRLAYTTVTWNAASPPDWAMATVHHCMNASSSTGMMETARHPLGSRVRSLRESPESCPATGHASRTPPTMLSAMRH